MMPERFDALKPYVKRLLAVLADWIMDPEKHELELGVAAQQLARRISDD